LDSPEHAATLTSSREKLNGRAQRIYQMPMSSKAGHPLIFDRALIRRRRMRALRLGPSTFLLERVVVELADRLGAVMRRFECAVDLGTPGDLLRRALSARGQIGRIVGIDALAHALAVRQGGDESMPGELAAAADEESLPLRDASLDLVVSALSLQFVNDLPGALVQIRRALKPDGLLLAALLGGDSLTELRQAFAVAEAETEGGVSPRVIPFLDVQAAGALLQRAGFALPVTDVDRIIVRYDSALALMRDLRAMGATNPMVERSRRPLKRMTLRRVIDVYAERFADPDQRIRATFDIVWLSGWAAHESQQKPLAPGSAQRRLADALGAAEISTGERAGGNE
jgi:SAM-dependent methyltransferase